FRWGRKGFITRLGLSSRRSEVLVATVGHIAVGMLAARGRRARLRWTVGLCALSLAPDLDVIAFRYGIRYADPFGHRGATHSVIVAMLSGALALVLARAKGRSSVP